MAVDTGYEILVGSSVSADKHASILTSILQVVSSRTRSITYAATYSAGTTSVNQATISIGTTVDLGIRLIMDSAVVGTAYVASLLGSLITVLSNEGVTLTNGASYVAGNRAYNVTVTLT